MNPGDVCEHCGAIISADGNRPVRYGVIYVTEEQAQIAVAHGWTRLPDAPTGDGIVKVAK